LSVQNTGGYPTLFTSPGSPMQTMTPAGFTIEASFKPETGGWRTLVGRDSRAATATDTNLAALYFQITPVNAVAIRFCDVAGYWHEVDSAPGIVQGFNWGTDPNGLTGRWYHMAAVSDGTNLSLYLASDFGYDLVAQTDLTLSGSPNTALTAGLGSGSDWTAGTWTVGRGLYAGTHTDRAYGFIDEVRISDAALAPEQFLFWRPPILVTNTADSGAGSLRAALASAANGDTIDAAGVSGTITLTSGQLEVSTSVRILGPGPGLLTVSGNNASRVFHITGANVTINGLTIANGYGATLDGAGIRADGSFGSALTVSDCVITNNRALGNFGGGGLLNGSGVTMTITNCTISGNSAQHGGGVFNFNGVVHIDASTLSGNSAILGGGIFNDGYGGSATLTINTSTLSGNSASLGCGIFNDGSSGGNATLTINASTLSGNSAAGAGFGGGIYNDGSSSGNATLTINASTLSGNSADIKGGGIYNDGTSGGNAAVTINTSTLSGNSAAGAGYGGGICNEGYEGSATVAINASTLSGNSAEYDGGGIYQYYGTLEVGGTLLSSAAGGNICNSSGIVISGGYNLSRDAAGGDGTTGPGGLLNATGDIRNSDPMLGPLQDNGGPTWTHALLPGSPALDKGKRNAITNLASATDQRGFARPVLTPGVAAATGGDGSDIGAVEVQGMNLDTDADGLPDDWERAWFGNMNQSATDDFDHDGQNNERECMADTCPVDANDCLRVISFTRSGTYNTLWWSSKATRLYQVQRCATLDDSSLWETIITNSVPGWNNVGFDSTGEFYFYRIRVLVP
jgi:hypothetical protein